MTEETVVVKEPRSPSALTWIVGVISGLFLTVLVVLVALGVYSGISLTQFVRGILAKGMMINVSQPVVVRQIQQLQRLETVVYTLEHVVEGEHSLPALPRFLAGDRILLIVHGEVVAGVDLSRVTSSDVAVQGRSIRLHLPKAELFSTRIDNQKTRVYSRDTGILMTADPNLETAVRREAERQLQEAALNDGILNVADQNARATLTSLLRGFGFEYVELQ